MFSNKTKQGFCNKTEARNWERDFKLQTTNQLYDYLQMIDKEANEMYERLLIDFKKQRNVTEELKENYQMKWVQEMNNIENCLDEIIRINL